MKRSARKQREPVARIRDAFFALHFDIHPQDGDTELYADVTDEMAESLCERVRPDYIYYDCKGHPGYAGFPTEQGWPSPGIRKEALAIFRAATRKVGAKLVIHYSGLGDNCAAEKRPEWARVFLS